MDLVLIYITNICNSVEIYVNSFTVAHSFFNLTRIIPSSVPKLDPTASVYTSALDTSGIQVTISDWHSAHVTVFLIRPLHYRHRVHFELMWSRFRFKQKFTVYDLVQSDTQRLFSILRNR